MMSFTNAVIAPARHDSLAVIAGFSRARISPAETDGALAVTELTVPPGKGQTGTGAEEGGLLYVLDGRLGFVCGEEHVVLDAGGCIALPPCMPHRFHNPGTVTSRLLVVATTGHA